MDKLRRIQKDYNIDLLYDVFLRESDSVFLLIEDAHEITSKGVEHLFGDYEAFNLPKDIKNLDNLLSYIDPKSEICEIRGVKEYTDELRRELNSDQTKIVLYFPLIINNVKQYLELKAFKFLERNVSVILLNPIDVKKVNLETLYFESYKDSLTGLFNFNTLILHLNKTYGDHYFGFIDIDRFKSVNDTYGHKKGDEVLARIGRKLIEMADEHVIMYRKSGDEFIFMTINLNYEEALQVAHKIQNIIRSTKLPAIKIDGSVGLVEFKDRNGYYNVFDAVTLADIAMYMSKNKGRGNITYLDENEARNIMAFGPLEETLNALKSKGR